jgi:hypothetical protein
MDYDLLFECLKHSARNPGLAILDYVALNVLFQNRAATGGFNETEFPALNAIPTSEQFQLGIRLESIFMPYARRQRDTFYNSGIKPAARSCITHRQNQR